MRIVQLTTLTVITLPVLLLLLLQTRAVVSGAKTQRPVTMDSLRLKLNVRTHLALKKYCRISNTSDYSSSKSAVVPYRVIQFKCENISETHLEMRLCDKRCVHPNNCIKMGTNYYGKPVMHTMLVKIRPSVAVAGGESLEDLPQLKSHFTLPVACECRHRPTEISTSASGCHNSASSQIQRTKSKNEINF